MALVFPLGPLSVGFIGFSVTLFTALLGAWATAKISVWLGQRRSRKLSSMLTCDPLPAFASDRNGAIIYRNEAAKRIDPDAPTIASSLERTFANAGTLLFQAQNLALRCGHACKEVHSSTGYLRITVHRVEQNILIWRVDDLTQDIKAMQDTFSTPMLTIRRDGAVVWKNAAARHLIQNDDVNITLSPNESLCSGQVVEVNTPTGPADRVVLLGEAHNGRQDIALLPPVDTVKVQMNDRDFFDLVPVALLQLDQRGKVERVNTAALELLGRGNCTGMLLSSLMEGLGRSLADWLADAAVARGVRTSEFLRLTRTDKEIFVQVTLHRIVEGGKVNMFAVLIDATEFKTLEAQFVQSQKMQAIGELAGGIAHDFNNLLTAIGGHCDLLLLRHDHGDPDFTDLEQINQNANRAAALVNQLLAFSRKQTLRPESIDIRNTLADLTHLLNRLVGEPITLTLEHDPSLRPIRADKRQLEQVLMNLVVNARDAMPKGGEIRIETKQLVLNAPFDRDSVTVPAGEYLIIRVHDQGEGMTDGLRKKVFEPFFTTKRVGEGTGLGLSTAYGIIKQSGGFIFVDSTPGEGSIFSIYLPSNDIAPKVAKLAHDQDTRLSKQVEGVILLVEDEAPVRAFAARALRLQGYTVIEASSAEEALRLLQDADLRVDIFVTDVIMPGEDGPSWVRRALEKRPETRVVFMSGYAEESFSDAQVEFQNSVFLPKPFSLQDLTKTVHDSLQ